MYGFQDLASQQQQRFWVYTGNKNNTGFQTWIKPPGISFVHIITIGPGGGGSSTFPLVLGTANRGGGGGGGGSMNSVFLPAFLVPDRVYVNVGLGGLGGASSSVANTANIGTAGQDLTYVTFHPVKSAGYALCNASPGGAAAVPVGGGGGGAQGGAAGATATSTFFPNSQIGLRNYQGGQAGGAGANGAATSVTGVTRITGGGGGAGNTGANVVGAGASILPVGEYTLQTIASSPAGTNGSQLNDLLKFVFSGGTGAASSTTISGSDGGNGGYGCGGGGGGLGPGLGGAGGKGGDGLVIITCG